MLKTILAYSLTQVVGAIFSAIIGALLMVPLGFLIRNKIASAIMLGTIFGIVVCFTMFFFFHRLSVSITPLSIILNVIVLVFLQTTSYGGQGYREFEGFMKCGSILGMALGILLATHF